MKTKENACEELAIILKHMYDIDLKPFKDSSGKICAKDLLFKLQSLNNKKLIGVDLSNIFLEFNIEVKYIDHEEHTESVDSISVFEKTTEDDLEYKKYLELEQKFKKSQWKLK